MSKHPYDTYSDSALVRAILSGDGDAYEAVIARYRHMVYSVVLHILPGDPEAEDVAQETFIDGYFRLSTLRDADKLIVIENGKMPEKGTATELLKAKGVYYKLYKMQAEALMTIGIEE